MLLAERLPLPYARFRWDSLKKSSDEKEKLLQQIKSGEIEDPKDDNSQSAESESSENKQELSEWEKRLEGIS